MFSFYAKSQFANTYWQIEKIYDSSESLILNPEKESLLDGIAPLEGNSGMLYDVYSKYIIQFTKNKIIVHPYYNDEVGLIQREFGKYKLKKQIVAVKYVNTITKEKKMVRFVAEFDVKIKVPFDIFKDILEFCKTIKDDDSDMSIYFKRIKNANNEEDFERALEFYKKAEVLKIDILEELIKYYENLKAIKAEENFKIINADLLLMNNNVWYILKKL
jgi:tetratricopeptide (TPR) repeat protein